jgi:hypothetical protein
MFHYNQKISRYSSLLLLFVCLIFGTTAKSVLGKGDVQTTPTEIAQTSALNSKTQQALKEALADEYKSRAFYQAVINKFGEVRPFSNIVMAEARHANALEQLMIQYKVAIPPDAYANKIEAPGSLLTACQMSIVTEKENREMYDRFLAFIQEPDIRMVLERLRDASQQKHLPAFERCQQRLSRF